MLARRSVKVKNRKIRTLMGFCIALMPNNMLRILLYKLIFGYRISRSRIGWKTIIVVDDAELNECHLGRKNTFLGPMKVIIKKGAGIGNSNKFTCGWWSQDTRYNSANYDRYLEIGENTVITSEHHIDVVGAFVLGNASWIAGCGSQFWTHGAGASERNIRIGEHCYIGSAVRFAPGSSIGNNTIVALGSVLTREFNEENVILGGMPAKVLRDNYDWKTKKNIC